MTENMSENYGVFCEKNGNQEVGCVAQLAVCQSLAGELTLSYARPAADG